MSLLALGDRVRSFNQQEFLQELLTDFSNDNQSEIFDKQISQFDQGENSEGNTIGIYSYVTELLTRYAPPKGGRKYAGDPWDLFSTGELRENLFTENHLNGDDIRVIIDSKSSTKNDLFETIRSRGLIDDPASIFGAQEDTRMQFAKLIQKMFVHKYQKRINGSR